MRTYVNTHNNIINNSKYHCLSIKQESTLPRNKETPDLGDLVNYPFTKSPMLHYVTNIQSLCKIATLGRFHVACKLKLCTS